MSRTLTCAEGHEWSPPPGTRSPLRCPEHAAARTRELNKASRLRRRENEAYLLRDREQRKRVQAAYVERHRERVYARYREWAKAAGKDTVLANVNRRRALILQAPQDGTDPTWPKAAERDGMECAYCPVTCVAGDNAYAPDYPTLDHVIPLSKGGAHSMDNAVLACRKCNSEKNAMVI